MSYQAAVVGASGYTGVELMRLLAGHPAISVPYGTGAEGLPVGVQVLGPALAEGTVLKVAAVLEAAAPELPVPALVEGSRR